ncbi:hypothetical protein [Galbibacter mesophilus]|uniref:hypothetical protein n=1 Tax=Galbibacter mesophilus TaxID=379069 RepID=UPI00191F1B0C|nr:hypothetical protein [Galbibacter mesophilus]MCM5662585.1 hypothetical protein [Galbibacter mesophilus]
MVFLFGLTAMSSNKEEANTVTDEAVLEMPPACEMFFSACDAQNPDSHDDFDSCMSRNGC